MQILVMWKCWKVCSQQIDAGSAPAPEAADLKTLQTTWQQLQHPWYCCYAATSHVDCFEGEQVLG
eukprot:1506-Heterococcus_DN1.PRE.4